MKKIFFLIFFLALCLTQQSLYAETITLTTYYPAPFGAYDRLRLVPRGDLIGSCDPGTLYMKSSTGDLQFCQRDMTWGPLSGAWKQVGDLLYPVDYANPNLKVGIGTNTPNHLLEIVGGPLVLRQPGEEAHHIGTIAGSGGDLSFGTDRGEVMRLGNNGNVGIGTTTPAYRLEVQGGVTKTTGGLVIETRTSDPPSPEPGRIWLIVP